MNKKKIAALGLSVVIAAGLFVGCGKTETDNSQTKAPDQQQVENQTPQASEEKGQYEDGIYFAQEDGFNEKTGWKYMVTLEVKDGKIVKLIGMVPIKKAEMIKKLNLQMEDTV